MESTVILLSSVLVMIILPSLTYGQSKFQRWSYIEMHSFMAAKTIVIFWCIYSARSRNVLLYLQIRVLVLVCLVDAAAGRILLVKLEQVAIVMKCAALFTTIAAVTSLVSYAAQVISLH